MTSILQIYKIKIDSLCNPLIMQISASFMVLVKMNRQIMAHTSYSYFFNYLKLEKSIKMCQHDRCGSPNFQSELKKEDFLERGFIGTFNVSFRYNNDCLHLNPEEF